MVLHELVAGCIYKQGSVYMFYDINFHWSCGTSAIHGVLKDATHVCTPPTIC